MKANLEQLEEMQKELFKQQCDLDIQKAMVKHFIKKEKVKKLTLTDVGSSTEFKVWDDLFGILSWKFIPTKSGDMMIDAEEVYNELKDKFELKSK